MKTKSFALVIAASGLAACNAMNPGTAARGVVSVHQPVIQHQVFAIDLAAPGGALDYNEAQRLDGWFQTLDFGYGDSIHLDGPAAAGARADVARIASTYGMMVRNGAPVTAGAIAPGVVRVIVSRATASVVGCPDWSKPAAPNYSNVQRPGYGCAVNGNLAAMVANPEDLVHGREGSGVGDTVTTSKAVDVYRQTQGSGTKGLQAISTKSGGK